MITITAPSGAQTQHATNTEMRIGQLFRLIGRTTHFRAVTIYNHPVAGPTVSGHSVCGRCRTSARICDTMGVEPHPVTTPPQP